MLQIINMYVNGRREELAVDIRESLLETLRERLNLTSVMKGCGVGECGACTVLVDGVAVDACLYLTMWGRKAHPDDGRTQDPDRGAESDPAGICGRGGRAVRFLHAGPDHDSCGAYGKRAQVYAGRTAEGDCGTSLPLHGL